MITTLRAGFFVLALAPFVLSSCGSDDSGNNPNPNPNPNPTNPNPTQPATGYYFKATIDGQTVSFVEDQNNYIQNGVISTSTPDSNGIYPVTLSMELKKLGIDDENIGYVSVTDLFPNDPTTAQKESIWHTGTYNYTPNFESKGAYVEYIDANGKRWNTIFGSANQTGSTFTVAETTPYQSGFGTGEIVKGTFSCKLYSEDGQVKTAANGSFRGLIGFN